MDVSIGICTYNGADRVPEVLDHLRDQHDLNGIQWEVIVIDNNSSDATKDVIQEYQDNWIDGVPLRYVFEQRQGKSFAMEHAMEEARGTWVAFLDDDNLPAPDWVAEGFRFAQEHPDAGAFGGQVHGLFERTPTSSFGLVQSLFAINERKEEVCYTENDSITFGAPGAGLWIRKEAWMQGIPDGGLSKRGTISNKRGEVGEDFEIQWYLYKDDWDIWHNPRMHMHHKIPTSRLNEEYLQGFFKAIGRSRHNIRMLRYPAWQRPLATMAYLVSDTGKLLKLLWKYRSKVWSDPFIIGRARMRIYMLAEPFKQLSKWGATDFGAPTC